MREFTYLIPVRYVSFKDEPLTKPIAVKAWETCVPGLIAQQPILPSRGRVHLTHKASGTVLAYLLRNKQKAQAAARILKKLPLKFTVTKPAGIYRQVAKLTDRQVNAFRAAVGHKKPILPEIWRGYARTQALKFDELHPPAGRRKRGKPAKRSKRGK